MWIAPTIQAGRWEPATALVLVGYVWHNSANGSLFSRGIIVISDLRDELREARSLAELGDIGGVLQSSDRALTELAGTRLVTMAEAATLLGLKSPEALGPIMHHNGVLLQRREGQILVALSKVEGVCGSEWVEHLRELDRLHDLTEDLGREMTQ